MRERTWRSPCASPRFGPHGSGGWGLPPCSTYRFGGTLVCSSHTIRVLAQLSLYTSMRFRAGTDPAVGQRSAVFPQRFMSGRVPIPDPAWKQNPDLDNVVPSNLDQATGLERAEILAEMEGRSIFEEAVSVAARRNALLVSSHAPPYAVSRVSQPDSALRVR